MPLPRARCRQRLFVATLATLAARARCLRVTFIRHGETVWNAQGKLQGALDSPLTEAGVRQAELCGQRLANTRFVAAYTSPLPRARRTAELVLDQLEAPPPLAEEPLLRERCFGDWEGMQWEVIESRYPEQLKLSRGADYRLPGGGESRTETLGRSVAFLDRLVASHEEEEDPHVLCVAHSGTLTTIIKEVLGLPQGAPRSFMVRNLAINELRHTPDRGWMLLCLGDVAHLEGGA